MANRIKANTERMRRDVENMIAFVRQMEGNYRDLVQRKGELDGMWDGLASESFRKAFDDDLSALQIMVDELKEIYSYEDMARGSYNACEHQVSEMISGI